jgi:tellurite resistance protein TehA-like permease
MRRWLRGALEPTLAAIPPASGAVVMGTGVVSIGLSLDGRETLSRVLLVIAAIVWIVLGLLLIGRAAIHRDRFHREARSPAALTGVAGTGVLGTRLTLLGWNWAGIALLVIALAFWLVLLGPVLANWVTPTIGVSLVLTVSTESLAVLAATLAEHERAPWLLQAALVPFVLGLAFYGFVIARFDLQQITTGHGDHWIAGGALAISTLAIGRIALGADALHTLTGIQDALEDVSLVLWAAAIAWLPVLVVAEVRHPRLGYDVRRWATVFPVGMYAACSFAVGSAAEVTAITDFARIWIWVAVALWLVVAAAMLRGGLWLVRGRHPPVTPERIAAIAPSRRS